MSLPPKLDFLFQAPSGNQARIVLTTLGNRTAANFGWKEMPPSEEDMRAAESAVYQFLKDMQTRPVEAVSSTLFTDQDGQEAMERDRREFLGGGKG